MPKYWVLGAKLDIVLIVTWLLIQPKHSGDVCFSDQLQGTIVKCLDALLPPLELAWQQIGFDGDVLDAQHRSVLDHIHSVISDLTAEAEHLKQQLTDNINSNQASLEKMSKELAQPSSVQVL